MKSQKRKVSTFGKIIRIILIILLSPFLILRAIAISVKKRKIDKLNAQKVAIFNISQVDLLSGIEFEELLLEIFKTLGYSASLTKTTGDFGADLIIEKKGKRYAVQAKCYTKTVGAHAVQEVIGAKQHYRASDAIVVTNNYFSNEARQIAAENDIVLLDRNFFINILPKTNVAIFCKKSKYCATIDENRMQIESKYRNWI